MRTELRTSRFAGTMAMGLVVALACFGITACGVSRKSIVIGSKNEPEQTLVAEIVAQHIEHRLRIKVERRTNLSPATAYQMLVGGELSLYPEYTGAIETNILNERPDTDREVVRERTRSEMSRLAKLELLDPLGYDNPPVVVVRTVDAQRARVKTLSEAAEGTFKWRLAVSYEFQQRPDGLPALNSYKLPMGSSLRGLDAAQLFSALMDGSGDVTMIVATSTNGRLVSPDLTILKDDKNVFPAYEACLLVRQDVLAVEPRLRAVLSELSGKFTLGAVRVMDAQTATDRKPVAEVAAEFLASVGLH